MLRAPRQPATRAHVDQTVFSGPQRVRQVMGDQAEALLAGRAAIINVWRPISHAARDWPLAVLVDQETRGGGEWIAAALQDNHAAVVMGAPTVGAGCGHTDGGTPTKPPNQKVIHSRTNGFEYFPINLMNLNQICQVKIHDILPVNLLQRT